MRPKSPVNHLIAVHNGLCGMFWGTMACHLMRWLLLDQKLDEESVVRILLLWGMASFSAIAALSLFGTVVSFLLPIRGQARLIYLFQMLAALGTTSASIWWFLAFGHPEKDISFPSSLLLAGLTMTTITCAASVWYRYCKGELA